MGRHQNLIGERGSREEEVGNSEQGTVNRERLRLAAKAGFVVGVGDPRLKPWGYLGLWRCGRLVFPTHDDEACHEWAICGNREEEVRNRK